MTPLLDTMHDESIQPQPQGHHKPLSFKTKLAYGAGDSGAGITATLLAFSFLIFLTNVANLRPALAGTVLLIGKIWDAVNDPIIGYLSDRTRSRWGTATFLDVDGLDSLWGLFLPLLDCPELQRGPWHQSMGPLHLLHRHQYYL